jgi:hypothetical protein
VHAGFYLMTEGDPMVPLLLLVGVVVVIDVLSQRHGVDSRLDRGDWQPRSR